MLSEPTSQMKVVDDGKKSGTIVLLNKAATALQLNLYLTYNVQAFTVEDGAKQDFTVTVTDTDTGDTASSELHPTFETHVDRISLSKDISDNFAPNGCYYEWHESLEKRFKLSEQGIDEAAFKELCKDNYFVTYLLNTRPTSVNQRSTIYIDERPVGGEAVSVAYMNSTQISSGTPLEKVTEGEFAGQWKYDDWSTPGKMLYFFVLVKYPKSGTFESDVDAATGVEGPVMHNEAEATFVGLDNDGAKRASSTASRKSVWLDAAAGDRGDIWGVYKEGHPDPAGALNILRNGGDVKFSYDITGIGLTYKYIADHDYEKANGNNYSGFGGPYKLELVDDALYVNGLGTDGNEIERLKSDDFYFKTFTMNLQHDVVEGVDLKGDVRDKHVMPITDREQIEVWVMTDGSEEWKLDQKLDNIALLDRYGRPYDNDYADADNNNVFEFKNDKVYRVKFVYNGANGDIKMKSTVSGILRSKGSTVQKVLANLDANEIGNFQLFNWDAEMGYDAKGVWQDPAGSGTIKAPTPKAMKSDLLELDAGLYEGHAVDRIANRKVAKNNLTEVSFFSGAGKLGESNGGYNKGIKEEDGKVKAKYTIAAIMGGGAVSEENLNEMIDLGVLADCREIVFYELLPVGMKIKNVTPFEEGGVNWASFRSGEYTWDRFSNYAGDITSLSEETPTVTYTVEDNNYKGTFRQMVKITVKYETTPIVKMGFSSIGGYRYALGEILYIEAEADYADLRSQTLDNNVAAQFISDGKPLELDGTAVSPDDGSVFEHVTDKDGNKVFDDVDGDGDHSSKNIVGATVSATWQNTVASTQLIKKIKEDELDDDFRDYTQTYAGHNYTYKLQFLLGEGTVRDLVIFDSIEEAVRNEDNEAYYGKSDWKGTLYGVDIQEAKDMGFDEITVYVNTEKYFKNKELANSYEGKYSGLTSADMTEANGWYAIDPETYADWDKVKTIAFGFGKNTTFGTKEGDPRGVTVYLKMTAPDTIHKDQTKTSQILAYNQPAYYSEKRGIGDNWDPDTTVANVVTIGMKSAVADIPAITKTYTGEELYEGFEETCVFDIEPLGESSAPRAYKDGEWGDEIDSVSITLNAEKSEDIASDNGSLLFTEPGEHEYEISERADSKAGVTYSGAKYKVVFSVTDEREVDGDVPQYAADTELAVEMKIYRTHDEDGKALDEPIEVESIEFRNDYAPKPVEANVEVEKQIKGAAPEEAETYEFELTAKDGAPAPEDTTVTISGEGKAAFGEWQYEEVGVYEYEVVEVKGESEDCEYDSTVYTVTDTVTDNKGELEISRVIKADDSDAEAVVFVNTYEEEEDSSSEDEDDSSDSEITTDSEDSSDGSSSEDSSESDSSSEGDSSSEADSSSQTDTDSSSKTDTSSKTDDSSKAESSSESDSTDSTDVDSDSGSESSSEVDSVDSTDSSSSGGDSSTDTGSGNPNTGSHVSLGFVAAILGAAICVRKKSRSEE